MAEERLRERPFLKRLPDREEYGGGVAEKRWAQKAEPGSATCRREKRKLGRDGGEAGEPLYTLS